ncbi:agouti signaling protein 1 isoform X3 [Colossoma macropomum]|nr:agouti signaling protein 1 isoform X3 [Colossoma macropomum]
MLGDSEATHADGGAEQLQPDHHNQLPEPNPLPRHPHKLSKTSKKAKKSEQKPQKTKLAGQVKRPPPPPNCTPLWGSCKSPNSVCCEHCAFCSCRLLRTVCYCRMGYPRC